MALDQPFFVVVVLESLERSLHVLDALMHWKIFSQSRFSLEKRMESIGTAVAFGRASKGRRRFDFQPTNLALEIMTDVLRPVVVADGEAGRDVFRDGSESLIHLLADRLQRFEARAPLGGVQPQASWLRDDLWPPIFTVLKVVVVISVPRISSTYQRG